MKNFSAFLFAVLFALGLALARMTDPHRVIAFLEIGPHWSENLLFVMIGALIVTLTMFPLILRRKKPLLDTVFHYQTSSLIDRRLILGSALFGIGWGISGYCPGPLVVGLASLKLAPWTCFIGFLIGQLIVRKATRAGAASCE
jgi:uncharacterized membrane protein YedE/YeeE